MIARIRDTTSKHLVHLLVARHAAPAILAGTLALAGGGAAYLNHAFSDHDGHGWCPPTGLTVTGNPDTGSYTYHRCDWNDEDGR